MRREFASVDAGPWLIQNSNFAVCKVEDLWRPSNMFFMLSIRLTSIPHGFAMIDLDHAVQDRTAANSGSLVERWFTACSAAAPGNSCFQSYYGFLVAPHLAQPSHVATHMETCCEAFFAKSSPVLKDAGPNELAGSFSVSGAT